MKIVFLLLVVVCQTAFSQGYGNPLTIQGLDRTSLHSAASRGAGGITITMQNQAALMFSNPASLQTVKTKQVSVGVSHQWLQSSQVQQYAPLKYYSNYSLLMEGLTGLIPDPDTSIPNPNPNPGDTVQRPFDSIQPNWNHKDNGPVKSEIFIALPFMVGSMEMTAGLGFLEYANLNRHYENHNVTDPSVGSERPVPVLRPSSDSVPFITHWSSYMQSREGSIRGYGFALSGSLSEKFSLGFSGIILDGSTDDYEQRIERGTITFYRDWFRLDSVYGVSTKNGASDYSGFEFSLGGIYRGSNVSFGFTVKPPATITRSYSVIEQIDTAAIPTFVTNSAEDKIKLPWRGSVGIGLSLRDNLSCSVEYEIRSYASAVYQDSSGNESNPWLSAGTLRAGIEYNYNEMLVFRLGARQQAEVFEVEGNPLEGDPVSYSVYSAGCGISFLSMQLNLAYEYGSMKYEDLWQTNVNFNRQTTHAFVADVVYTLPR